MKNSFLFLFLIIFASSCSTYQASVKKHEKLQYESVRVYPEWKYKEPKAKKAIVPVLGLAAGAAYGYFNETTFEGETYSGSKNAAIWGLGGLVAGALVNGILFPKKNYKKTKYDISQSEKWIKSYNKTTKSNYTIKEKDMNNSLVIVPLDRVEQLRVQYKKLIQDLNSSNPTTNYAELQDWKSQLKNKYSILPTSELNYISDVIATNEQKVANKDISSKTEMLKDLQNEYSSIGKLNSFKRNNQSLYYDASSSMQNSVDKIIETKLSDVLENELSKEKNNLQNIDQNLTSASQIDQFYRAYNQKYQAVKNHPKVKELKNQIISKKTALINQNVEQISREIKSANNQIELSTITDKYLSNIDSQDFTGKNLSSKIQERRNQLIEEANRKAIAEKRRIENLKNQRKDILARLSPTEQGKYLNELDFSTEGLKNENFYKNIYSGDFLKISSNYDRDEMMFSVLYNNYLNTYSSLCGRSLPANKIEITKEVCTQEQYTTNGWGVETSRNCISWKTVGTGLYAAPDMYRAKLEIDRIQARDALGNVWEMMLDMRNNPFGKAAQIKTDVETIKSDIVALISINGCNSPALKRFEENLRLFATNKAPIQLAKGNNSAPLNSAVYNTNQNYKKLAGDLVYNQSKKWAVNQYVTGSIYDVSIGSKDELGRASVLNAKYTFDGLNGRATGSVKITFSDGIPNCLYFHDALSTCRTPDRKTVAKFIKGDYLK